MRRIINHGIWVLALVISGVVGAATPEATTLPGSSVGPTATLNGSVNPGGADTVAWFEWGLVANHYTTATAQVSASNGVTMVAVSNLLTGLTPGFVYHYRVVASNALGVVRGRDVPLGSPALMLNGESLVTNVWHTAFVDPGATASNALLTICGAFYHSLALKSDRTIAAWGDNGPYGQTNVPAELTNVMAISASYMHSLALKSDGTVAAWGYNGQGQTDVPEGLSNVVAISAGGDFSLVLKSDGTITVFGVEHSPYQSALTNIPIGLSNVVAISAGRVHSLVLNNDGTVVVWGADEQGQTAIPVGLSNVVAIAAGGFHNLALKSDGTVAAWGDNSSGQSTIPAGLSNVVAVAGGDGHSMALKSDGTVVAWGSNYFGQTNVPAGLGNVVAIAGGFGHSLAMMSDGTVVGWGAKLLIRYGQTDAPEGLNTLKVNVSGNVDTNTLGSYVLTYSSSNSLSGFATVTRTVVVGDARVVNPPVLTGFTALSNGTFQFGLTNVPGASFTVFASADLALPRESWTNLGPAVETPAGSGQFFFSDAQATNHVQRFYQVRSP